MTHNISILILEFLVSLILKLYLTLDLSIMLFLLLTFPY